jgi:hypothetical protein
MLSTAKKKGGSYRVVILLPDDEDTFVLPAGFKITNIVTQKVGTVAGNFSVGTAADGEEIVASVALGTVNDVIAVHTLVASVISLVNDTTCHINLSAATADCNLYITMQMVI